MRKIFTIWLPLLILFISAVTIKIQLSSQASLFSPQQDQAIVHTPKNNSQITNIQPETNTLSFIANPISTQIADSVALENPTLANIAIVPAAIEDTPSPSPTPIETPLPDPTLIPSPTPKPPTPTSTPLPTKAPISTSTNTLSTTPAGSLSGDKILKLINDYRFSKNLSVLEKDDRSCQLAESRAPEIMHEVETGTMHKGLADRNLPYWDNENIAYYNTEQETVSWWIADTIHRKQLEGNFKYSCVECYKNACAQELTNFSPK